MSNPILSTQLTKALTLGILLSYSFYIPVVQMGAVVGSPSWGINGISQVAPLLNPHICQIVSLRCEKKMVGVAADGVITPVADGHTLRDRAIGEDPCKSGSNPSLPIYPELAVAVIKTECPRPAFIDRELRIYISPELREYLRFSQHSSTSVNRTDVGLEAIQLLSRWVR